LLRAFAESGVVPERIDVESLRASGRAPVGFAAALLPLARAQRDGRTSDALAAAVAKAPADTYYDHNLVLFGHGFVEGRFRFAARSGRSEEAKAYLAHLLKANPKHPDVPVLRREVELGPRSGPMLASARKLVHEGKKAEGAAKYAELFGEAGPPGDLALEYYQTLAGAPNGWQRAREGLARIVRRSQGEPRFKLELGKILTY